MPKKPDNLPADPKGWIEYIQKINYGDHKKAAASLGTAAAVGLGVGVYWLSRKYGGKKVVIDYADRHYEAAHTISVVESGPDAKFAVGLDMDEDHPSGLDFSMDTDGGIIRPDQQSAKQQVHLGRLRKAASIMTDLFTSKNTEGSMPDGDTVL